MKFHMSPVKPQGIARGFYLTEHSPAPYTDMRV